MKNLTLTIKEGGLGWLEWDQTNSSVNLFSLSLIEELESFVHQAEKMPLKTLALVSEKSLGFCAGADVKALQKFKTKQDVSKILKQVHDLFCRFEKLPFFKIVAISGTCLGAGLEWALCFDYRLCANSSSIQIGLPEVHLGLIPGFGACLRLPRLIGLKKSLPVILKGKSLNPLQALQMGLLDESVPSSLLNQRVLAMSRQMAQKDYSPQKYYKDLKPYWFFVEKALKNVQCFLARKQIHKKTRGFYPAPLKALEVIQKTFAKPVTLKNLEIEKNAFSDLYQSQTAKNLIRVFTLIDEAKKIKANKAISVDIQRAINHIGILGAGTMGRSIAYLFADRGFKVRLIDKNEQQLLETLKWTEDLWRQQQKKKQVNAYEAQQKKHNLSVSTNLWGLSTFNLVIEALPEKKLLKQKIIAQISKRLSPSCLFASNTSSFRISELAKSSLYPNNFFGLHFFYPAHKMRLVEISLTDKQTQFPLNSMRQVLKRLGKVSFFVKNSPGFIVNRLLVSFLTEALLIYEEGHGLEKIDHCYRNVLGMNLGPFQLMDKIGLDICVDALSNLKSEGLQMEVPHWAEQLNDLLGLGEKSGEGFYIYVNGEQSELNQKTLTLKRASYPSQLTCEKIIQRGIYRMIKEGKTLVKDNIVESEDKIDLAMILGTGFPPFLGGPMHYACNIGWSKVKKQLEELTKEYGSRFKLS